MTEDVPEVNSALDAVDGDEERLQANLDAAERHADRENADAPDPEVDGDSRVQLSGDLDPEEYEDEKARAKAEAKRRFEQGGSTKEPEESDDDSGSIFSGEESEAVDEQVEDLFDVKPVEDIPEDFDYEAQDTTGFGTHPDDVTVEHNGSYFLFSHPDDEERIINRIQSADDESTAAMFDVLIEEVVERPRDVSRRMEEENWTLFAKMGLAIKAMSYVGLDQLQDF